ncbi:hypothetical protein [Paenibacillus alkalitolerans]|uniref:hypothetical protein n=1 Tax=Paenibacillus alkalitolerans TaxID=2799335 RepID=UPI0018F3EA3C|nr:hypothetical protein [Paenibacillus alkalitolerans]
MTIEEKAQEGDGNPNTVYEDTTAHERIGFRQNDSVEYGSDSIQYGDAPGAKSAITQGNKKQS